MEEVGERGKGGPAEKPAATGNAVGGRTRSRRNKKRRSGSFKKDGNATSEPTSPRSRVDVEESGKDGSDSWRRMGKDAVGVAGGTWNLSEGEKVKGRQRPGKEPILGDRNERRTAKEPTTSSSSLPALPKVEPIVVSYEGLGSYLVTTSGPVLRVYKLPEGKCGPGDKSRAHEGTIVSLVAVPAAVNRLQAMTCAKCMTIVVWDVARTIPLAKLRIENLVEVQPGSNPVPLGLALGVGRKDDLPYTIGWLCMQTESNKTGNKMSSVRSFPLQFKDMLRLSGGAPGGRRKSKSLVLSKGAARKMQSGQPQAFKASYTGGLVAAADQNTVFLWKPSRKPEEEIPLYHTKSVTSLAISSGEDMLAVGDMVGQVLVYNLHEVSPLWKMDKQQRGNQPAVLPATFHWHSSSVLALEWGVKDETGLAPDVHYLYSGGSECTLVIWELPQGKRSYLPRFPAPLLSMKVCHSQREEVGMESYLAVGCADNSIVVVNVVTKSRVCTVAGLQVPYNKVVSLRRNQDGHAEVSLFKSNRGLLQKYDLDHDCQISKLSVSYNEDQTPHSKSKGKSFATFKSRGKGGDGGTLLSYCAEEQHLCTVEQQTEGMNIWLKFWSRTPHKKYEVEKTVLNPHEKKVTCVLGHQQRSLAITCSQDGKFKLWARVDNDWVCSCQSSVPTSHINSCRFSGTGDVFVASFADNIGFWDTSNLDLLAVLKCPPSLLVESFQDIALISEAKPAFVVGNWVSKKGNCKGISVWNLLTLKHLWSFRFEGNCQVCCTSLGTAGTLHKFAVSVATKAGSKKAEDGTKVLFFSPKSARPEGVWHVSAYGTNLFSIGDEVVIATKEGDFISRSFATKAQQVTQVTRPDEEKLREVALGAENGTTPGGGEQPSEEARSSGTGKALLDAGAGVPGLLLKYQATPSHDLPPMSQLFQSLLM
ncbi:WD40 repeat domain-containing protein [Chloropicon primus]|uniref:WD40 repeat domain-containing protein n=1 Tax=Chloropicon primus TaxID=1764295 RepID=A0A5B8ME94_9CHLO|nr:WD40 repeat domain-containing protein [Chloropicon primus]UPQ97905.1 WD40 repeat domain-containing protein [Chloropicon primus]|eukprot:QDZ18697.1 WD40 repeat domain-containing protein [Chloropicon primus]